jgi:drug/metabolite transporter (DMT)-like permease
VDWIRHRSGEAAALSTALLWAGSALFFAAAARRMGADRVNLLRLILAFLILGVTVLATGAASSLPAGQVAALALSGLIGLAAGDAAYFRCLEYLGARRGALLMAMAPVFTALLMVPLLDEGLGWASVAGMAVTLGGVAWVQGETAGDGERHEHAGRGVLFGTLGAVGQASGYVLAQVGLGVASSRSLLASVCGLEPRDAADGRLLAGVEASAVYGTFLRMAAATAGVVASAAILRRPGGIADALSDRPAMWNVLGGTLTGPVVGVSLSLLALRLGTNPAVASTILATSPVFVIPLVRVVHGERASGRAWLGALVAVGGVALLSFRGSLGG